MPQHPTTRAQQHLLLQGFTLYPCAAAVALMLLEPGVLEDQGHNWAIICDGSSMGWASKLTGDGKFATALRDCALLSAGGTLHAVCHTLGAVLVVPLDPVDAKDARMRIEAAVTLGKQPPAERLEAFGDEMIAREANRRGLIAKVPREPEPM